MTKAQRPGAADQTFTPARLTWQSKVTLLSKPHRARPKTTLYINQYRLISCFHIMFWYAPYCLPIILFGVRHTPPTILPFQSLTSIKLCRYLELVEWRHNVGASNQAANGKTKRFLSNKLIGRRQVSRIFVKHFCKQLSLQSGNKTC